MTSLLRLGIAAFALGVFSPALLADVRILIRKDGSKVIYNDHSRASARGTRGSDLHWLAKQRNRRSPYDPIIERYAERFSVDPVLVRAVIQVESNFNPMSVSNKGARGLMQLMPGTAKRFRVSKLHDPDENIRGGIAYLALLLRMFPDDLSRVLAAYNAGENAVKRYGGIPPYQETQTYVSRALTVYYGRPQGGGTIRLERTFPLSAVPRKIALPRNPAPIVFASALLKTPLVRGRAAARAR